MVVTTQSDVVGTTATSTKILASGKVLRKPVTNTTKNEWMQRKKELIPTR